jgi:uncharacterized protein YjeT (DUF2065 family)
MLVFEGIIPFINPQGFRRTLAMLAQMPDGSLRLVGLACMLGGVLLLGVTR